MKRVSAFLLGALLVLTGGFAFGQEEPAEGAGAGLTATLEIGFGDVAGGFEFSISPGIQYENSFGDLDLYGELDYTAAFGEPVAHSIYGEVELGYNIGLGAAGVLKPIVNVQETLGIVEPLDSSTVIEPSVKYTYTTGAGDLYGQLGLPVTIESGVSLGSCLTAGWTATFGLGLEAAFNFDLVPNAGFAGIDAVLSYDGGAIYGEIEVTFDGEFREIWINPEIDFNFFDPLIFWVRCEMNVSPGSSLTPFIGVSYSF